MAAPVEIEDANWHRSKQLHKECGWKHGDSAIVNLDKVKIFPQMVSYSDSMKEAQNDIDIRGLLMEVAHHPSGIESCMMSTAFIANVKIPLAESLCCSYYSKEMALNRFHKMDLEHG